MLAMLKRVFQILHGADKTLYQSLKASLTTESSSHTSGEDLFAIQLVPLLHPYVQRMFVGMYVHACLKYHCNQEFIIYRTLAVIILYVLLCDVVV